jgi:HK97 family phage portal protein
MAVIETIGGLETTRANWTPGMVRSGVRMYDSINYDYAELYRQQPNVRTCVDFLSRNVAQLGLHLFRRLSDTDRERVTDHPAAQRLSRPLPDGYKVTRYRLIESLMGDLGIYFNAYWLKPRLNGEVFALLRVPPQFVHVNGGLLPTGYEVTVGGKMKEFAPEDVVHFRGYNPENPLIGLSPLETLRRVLAEEWEMGSYRENFWRNAARQNGIIKRPMACARVEHPGARAVCGGV